MNMEDKIMEITEKVLTRYAYSVDGYFGDKDSTGGVIEITSGVIPKGVIESVSKDIAKSIIELYSKVLADKDEQIFILNEEIDKLKVERDRLKKDNKRAWGEWAEASKTVDWLRGETTIELKND